MSEFKHVLLPELYEDDEITGFVCRAIDDDDIVLHGEWNQGKLKPIEYDIESGVHLYLYDAMISVITYYHANGVQCPYRDEWYMMVDFINKVYPDLEERLAENAEMMMAEVPADEPVYEPVTEENVMEFI